MKMLLGGRVVVLAPPSAGLCRIVELSVTAVRITPQEPESERPDDDQTDDPRPRRRAGDLWKSDLARIAQALDDRLKGGEQRHKSGSADQHSQDADHCIPATFAARRHARPRAVAEDCHADAETNRTQQYASMDQTGMRWTVVGAQSLLHLRALYLNGDWNAFIAYRIEHEQKRLYPYKNSLAA